MLAGDGQDRARAVTIPDYKSKGRLNKRIQVALAG
jgi:hypothetical protein